MEYRELVKSIPLTLRETLSEKLMDIMLEAKDGSKVSSSLAKMILFYWQRDQLASEAGLTNLLKAVAGLDPIKTATVMDDFGLKEIKLVLRPI